MVSLHTPSSETPTTTVPAELFETSSNKRKRQEPLAEEISFRDPSKSEKIKSIFDKELHLETPIPSDNWQQCLSIQSGKIQFCSTVTDKNSLADPRRSSVEPPSLGHMSLDLELNLTSESLKRKGADRYSDTNEKQKSIHDLLVESTKDVKKHSGSLSRSPPSWLSVEGDQKEMVATVCMKCHMLVMLCKSSPSCPNCKFIHPPDENPSSSLFLKKRCGPLC